ncbi:MAG: hypothetical protein NVS2B15_21880 [Pseudarthrobacter sp.]
MPEQALGQAPEQALGQAPVQVQVQKSEVFRRRRCRWARMLLLRQGRCRRRIPEHKRTRLRHRSGR